MSYCLLVLAIILAIANTSDIQTQRSLQVVETQENNGSQIKEHVENLWPA